MNLLTSIKNNKVVIYLVTRYITFGLQFVVYLLLANKLGPYYMGIWGYFLLLNGYFSVINLGMPNSITISLVHNKEDERQSLNYEKSSFAVVGAICLLIVVFAVVCGLSNNNVLHKEELGSLFYVACIVGILTQYTLIFTSIARVKGHLMSIAFSLTITVVLMLLAVMFFSGEKLLHFLGGAFLIGNVLSIVVYVGRKNISFKGSVSREAIRVLIGQGLFLFIYNLCFQFIHISTRTLVGNNYEVEQFGFFSFAYTVAHSVILLLEAVAALIFPKVVDKFSSKKPDVVKKTIEDLRVVYISTTHLLMYFAISLIPLLLIFMPKYQQSLQCVNFMALTLLLYTNSYGYNTYLMSNHKEKLIARNAAIVLLINISLGLLLIKAVGVSYQYVLVPTMLSYFVYSVLCVFYGNKLLGIKPPLLKLLGEIFHIRIVIPFICAIIVSVINDVRLSLLPLFLFILLNIPVLKDIIKHAIVMIKNPRITDVK